MDLHTALNLLRTARPELEHRFGVQRLALFGQIARGDGDKDSDVDVLVRAEGAATSTQYCGVQLHLEDLFGRPLDLVTDAALREALRPFVERDAVRVRGRYACSGACARTSNRCVVAPDNRRAHQAGSRLPRY